MAYGDISAGCGFRLTSCREVVDQVASPSVAKMLSQDDSFFDQFVEQLSEEKEGSDTDMFGDSDGEDNTVDSNVVSKEILSPSLANSSVCSVDSQTPSLPMSVLDVRAKALEELRNKPMRI